MTDGWSALLICTVATAVNVVAQIVMHRATQGYVRSFLVGFATGLVVLLAGETLRLSSRPSSSLEAVVVIAADGLLYACGVFLYFGVVNVGESSIRVRLLRELSKSAGPTSEKELLLSYNDGSILRIRLGRMVRNGQVSLEGARYRLQSRPLAHIAAVVFGLKILVLGRSSEFGGHR
jgi:hypothetical protein